MYTLLACLSQLKHRVLCSMQHG